MGELIAILLGTGFIVWCIGEGIVRIIKVSKGGSGAHGKKMSELEADFADLEEELMDARKRIEVLEAIVTDGRQDLRRQIDELADNREAAS